eukprot:74343-Alexandrium_andersonii.AAC.1
MHASWMRWRSWRAAPPTVPGQPGGCPGPIHGAAGPRSARARLSAAAQPGVHTWTIPSCRTQ